MENNKKREPGEGMLLCEEILELIEKQKTDELSLSERNVILEHCMRCKECRAVEKEVLDKTIADFEEEEYDDEDEEEDDEEEKYEE
jgi:hypothetical protein